MQGLSALCLFCILYAPALLAKEDFSWSATPMLGIHSPALTGLNGAEFDATLTGTGSIIIDASSSVDVPFKIINPLEDIRYGTESGLEFELGFWPHDALLFGLGSWEGITTSQVITEMPFQGIMSQAAFERSADISYTQYYLGWKHYLVDRPRRYKVYSRLTLHELFDVDFRACLRFHERPGRYIQAKCRHGVAGHRDHDADDRRRHRLVYE